MFNRYHNHQTTTTIVEKRAPTDESIKLLAEMEKAAEAKVVRLCGRLMAWSVTNTRKALKSTLTTWSLSIGLMANGKNNEPRCNVRALADHSRRAGIRSRHLALVAHWRLCGLRMVHMVA